MGLHGMWMQGEKLSCRMQSAGGKMYAGGECMQCRVSHPHISLEESKNILSMRMRVVGMWVAEM
jgi:hypothetical protein